MVEALTHDKPSEACDYGLHTDQLLSHTPGMQQPLHAWKEEERLRRIYFKKIKGKKGRAKI
jgi:hypothetical protein